MQHFLNEALHGRKPSRKQLRDLQYNNEVPEERVESVKLSIYTDANSICTRTAKITMDPGLRKSRKTDIAEIKEYLDEGATIAHLHGPENPLDCLTKSHPSKRAAEAWYKWSSEGVWFPVFGAEGPNTPDPYEGVSDKRKAKLRGPGTKRKQMKTVHNFLVMARTA